jgi:hypothetical protein
MGRRRRCGPDRTADREDELSECARRSTISVTLPGKCAPVCRRSFRWYAPHDPRWWPAPAYAAPRHVRAGEERMGVARRRGSYRDIDGARTARWERAPRTSIGFAIASRRHRARPECYASIDRVPLGLFQG